LHGRNIEKLTRVKIELGAFAPERSLEVWVWDATAPVGAGGADLAAAILPAVASKRLVVLVNNVGYTSSYQPFAAQDPTDMDKVLHIQAFTVHLTRCLLPSMYADGRPALVINVAGLTRAYPAPLLAMHSGGKAFITAWSRGLALELELLREPVAAADVEVLCVDVHVVASNSNSTPRSLFAPDGDTMGRAIVGVVGCGHRVVTAYWAHELTACLLKWLPAKLMDTTLAKELHAMRVKELKVVEERERENLEHTT
jgi:17beta-estradiol 17-dehydrogenase / very-long-chain 3-oxoacyl-CoA reductase